MNTLAKVLPLVAVLEIAALSFSSYAAAPAKDGDPVLIGTVWKGKLTQKGEYKGAGGAPPEFDCEFTITKRDGEKFEADLFEKTPDLELTYLVRGTIKQGQGLQDRVGVGRVEGREEHRGTHQDSVHRHLDRQEDEGHLEVPEERRRHDAGRRLRVRTDEEVTPVANATRAS
jgi:hypothetical protein